MGTKPGGYDPKNKYENPLGELYPDEWKNIPICLVNAIKLIIHTNEANHVGIKKLNSKLDVFRNNIQS